MPRRKATGGVVKIMQLENRLFTSRCYTGYALHSGNRHIFANAFRVVTFFFVCDFFLILWMVRWISLSDRTFWHRLAFHYHPQA